MIPMFRSMVVDVYGWLLIWGRDSAIVSFVSECWPYWWEIPVYFSRSWRTKAAARPPPCLCSGSCIIQQSLHIINLGRKVLSNLCPPHQTSSCRPSTGLECPLMLDSWRSPVHRTPLADTLRRPVCEPPDIDVVGLLEDPRMVVFMDNMGELSAWICWENNPPSGNTTNGQIILLSRQAPFLTRPKCHFIRA